METTKWEDPFDGSTGSSQLRSRRHLVTGANGFVGSNLCRRLAASQAEVVALSRAGRMRTREALLGAACGHRWAFPEGAALRVQDYQLDADGLALPADVLRELFDRPLDFWHVAANVSFSSSRRSEVVESNLEGTRRALELFAAHAPRGSRFLLVSTAYVQGREQGRLEECFLASAPENAFHNAYEYSKREAERLFEEYRERGLVDGAILRLGQIVGDSGTGAITAPYGIYGFVDLVSELASHFERVSVRVPVHPAGAFHLVPIEWCVEGMVRVADRLHLWPGEPIFHIVPNRPLGIPAFVDALNALTPIRVVLAGQDDFLERPANELERLVHRRIRPVSPYILRPYEFACEHLRAMGDVAWFDCVSPDLMHRLLETYLQATAEAA